MIRYKKIAFFVVAVLVFLACGKEKTIEIEVKPFVGKTVVCFGASNTERGHWVERLSEMLGGTFLNIGIGGTTISQRPQSSELSRAWDHFSFYKLSDFICSGDYQALDDAVNFVLQHDGHDYRRQAELLKTIDFSKIDMLLISYGGNEFMNNTPIGDPSSFNFNTVLGAMNYTINNILSQYPHLKIMIHTTCYRWLSEDGSLDTDNTKNKLGLYTVDYANEIVEHAEKLHLPAINMVKNSGFNKFNHSIYFTDGSHFNQAGGLEYAKILSSWILSRYCF